MPFVKEKISIIAKYVVLEIKERGISGYSLGRCKLISEKIREILIKDYKYKEKDLKLIQPILTLNGNIIQSYGHFSLLIISQKLIVDTQYWQYFRFEDLKRRKVVFSLNEYKEKGFIL